MTVKTIHFLAIALLAAAVSSCQKDPSTSALHREYLVYTDRDRTADFAAFETFYLPDSILIIGNNKQTEYWKDADALEIVGTVAFELEAAGFLRISEKQNADLGVQLSYVERETYFVGSNNPYWWWYYPYYWSPGYWGDWMGWFYPYRVYYGYTAGSPGWRIYMRNTGMTAQTGLMRAWRPPSMPGSSTYARKKPSAS